MVYRIVGTCFLIIILVTLIGCKPPDVQQGNDMHDDLFNTKDLTGEGEFTSGIEGPAVDRDGRNCG